MFRLSLQPTLCRLQFVNAGFLAAELPQPNVDICEFCELIDFGNGTDLVSPFCLFTGKFRWHGANPMMCNLQTQDRSHRRLAAPQLSLRAQPHNNFSVIQAFQKAANAFPGG